MFSQQHRSSQRTASCNDNGRISAAPGKVAGTSVLSLVAQSGGTVILSYVADGSFIISRQTAI